MCFYVFFIFIILTVFYACMLSLFHTSEIPQTIRWIYIMIFFERITWRIGGDPPPSWNINKHLLKDGFVNAQAPDLDPKHRQYFFLFFLLYSIKQCCQAGLSATATGFRCRLGHSCKENYTVLFPRIVAPPSPRTALRGMEASGRQDTVSYGRTNPSVS